MYAVDEFVSSLSVVVDDEIRRVCVKPRMPVRGMGSLSSENHHNDVIMCDVC